MVGTYTLALGQKPSMSSFYLTPYGYHLVPEHHIAPIHHGKGVEVSKFT